MSGQRCRWRPRRMSPLPRVLRRARRHHPAGAHSLHLLQAVIRSQISPPPTAHGTAATPLNVGQRVIRLEAIDLQGTLMIARPVSLTLAVAIDEKLADPVGAN